MPTTVRLDEATLQLMRRLARRSGRTKSQIIRDALHRLGDAEGAVPGARTVYDAMEHAIGCWDSGGARLSEATDEKFRALLGARAGRGRAAPPGRAGGSGSGRRRRRPRATP